MLYSHDGLGLGHTRRTLAVAGALANVRPDLTLLGVLGSDWAASFPLPATFDYVKLPSIAKQDLFTGGGQACDPGAPKDVYSVREAILAAVAASFAPHLVLVDHEPTGFADELSVAIAALDAAVPRPRLVLGLRDVTFGPEETRALWRECGAYDLLDRVYDQIVVYGCRDVFDPVAEYGFSERAAAKTTFVGYVRPPAAEPAGRPAPVATGARATVVVSVGGGWDGAPVVATYLAALRQGLLAGVASYIVAGPQMPPADRDDLIRLAEGLPRVRIVPFAADLAEAVRGATAVVSMAGYNAVAEAVGAGKRPILIPRVGPSEEQGIRAAAFARLGLATMLHPDDLTPASLARAVEAEIASVVSPPPALEFAGAARAAGILELALPPPSSGKR